MAILASNNSDSTDFTLQFGAWVGGRKLEGPGARSALPTGNDVDCRLGSDETAVKAELAKVLFPFNGDSS